MKVLFVLALTVTLPALSACASNTRCAGVQPYERAETIPPLKGTENLKLPSSPSALTIPPPAPEPVAFGESYRNDKGKVGYRCLDVPPRLEPRQEENPTPEAG